MATEVGSAYVSILPSTRGFKKNLEKGVGNAGTQAGRTSGGAFGAAFGGGVGKLKGGLVTAIGAGAITAGLGSAINKAGDFDKTIRQVGATTGQSGAALKGLTNLALDYGAKTTFSAQDAANAMLSLSKGGLTAAQIKAGALGDTLTLAAAGGLDLGTAADYMVQGLTTFGLKANQGSQVAAALAGAANASTADVSTLGQALSQVGPSAVNMGLSIQETTAALAAFDNAGIKGSDAGTSLKTMLTALVPATDKAFNTMADLGLQTDSASKYMAYLHEFGVKPVSKSLPDLQKQVADVNARVQGIKPGSAAAVRAFTKLRNSGALTQSVFFDASGKAKDLTSIAGSLAQALNGLSDEAKTNALRDIFGLDALRAASVLAKNGATGIAKLIKATSDSAAATNLAKVGTQGYAGALEAFKGSVETAQIQLGTVLLPVATKVLNLLAGPGLRALQAFGGMISNVATRIRNSQLGQVFGTIFGNVSQAFSGGGISGAFAALTASLRTYVPIIGGIVTQYAQRLAGWIGPLVPVLLARIGSLLTSIGTAVVTHGPAIAAAVSRFAGAFLDWIGPLIPPLLQRLGGLFTALNTWLTTVAAPRVSMALQAAARALIDWISPRLPAIIQALGALTAGITAWMVSTGAPQLQTASGVLGLAVIKGIGQGILDNLPTLLKVFGAALPGAGFLGSILGKVMGGNKATPAPAKGPSLADFFPQAAPRPPASRTTAAPMALGGDWGGPQATYTGPITVRANNPSEIAAQLARRRRLEALAS